MKEASRRLWTKASTTFHRLALSHGLILWAVVLLVLSLLSIGFFDAVRVRDDRRTEGIAQAEVSRFKDIYEPSAAVQLPDGRVLIAEDEAERAFRLLTVNADGTLARDPEVDTRLIRSFGRELSDIEGLASDPKGTLYAVTSHSRTRSGRRSAAREQLLRFRIDGELAREVDIYDALLDELQKSTQLHEAIAARTSEAFRIGEINIEGLAYDAPNDRLLLGFREPTVDGLSLIVGIGNTSALFDRQASPQIQTVALLDLDGGGVRSLSVEPTLGHYLLVNEVQTGSGTGVPRLWSWSGSASDNAEALQLPGLDALANVESLDSIMLGERAHWLITSDDGDHETGSPASYLLLERDRLSYSPSRQPP